MALSSAWRAGAVLAPVLAVLLVALVLTVGGAPSDEPAPTRHYEEAVLAEEPVGYWRLEQHAGARLVEDSAGRNRGVAVGGVRLGVAGALAQGGLAAALNGSDAYLEIPHRPALSVGDAFTVELWARPDPDGEVSGALVQKSTDDGDDFEHWEYRLGVTSEHRWRGTVFTGDDSVAVTDPRRVSTSGWTHLAMTVTARRLRLFVDGSLVSSTRLPDPVNTGRGVLAVGRAGGSEADYFRGDVDEVAVYASALDPAVVAAHHSLGRAGGRAEAEADFTANHTTGTAPLFVTFSDTSTGFPHQWKWDFGDGTGSTQQHPTHRYARPGTYTVTLTSRNSVGADTVTKEALVRVRAKPPGEPHVLAGAGDIADCSAEEDSQTAALLQRIGGTVFALGDNAYPNGSESDFLGCYEPTWGRVKSRTAFAVVGNHEYLTLDAMPHFEYFGDAAGPAGRGWFSRDVGGWHVVVLNSNCEVVPGLCEPDSPQLRWLRRDLARSQAACTLALWHHPYVSSGIYDEDPQVLPFWEELYDAGADLIVNAHEHMYERLRPMAPDQAVDEAYGIPTIIAGTGGKELRDIGDPHPASVVRNNDTFGVLKLTLHDGRADVEFVPVPGDSFTDGGTVACHDAPPSGR